MKYNILTVINEGYAAFGILFLNSLFEFMDLKNVEKILVYDTGLTPDTRNYFSYFPKVEIIATGANYESGAIHDKGWKENTYSKTKYLLESLEKTNIPTFMIDSDCIFTASFEHLIDFNSDIIVCARAREGFSKHIGSFFGAINIEKSRQFLVKWINNVTLLQETTDMKHCESPALSKTISEESLSIQELPEQVVSAIFPDKTSLIYHLKSDHYALTVEKRLALPHSRAFTERYF
jgi:hypothetical protein|tara:strand:- start:1004 stop:1708 length:705 start_codon:yes stop_codon:yes gene_type:complete